MVLLFLLKVMKAVKQRYGRLHGVSWTLVRKAVGKKVARVSIAQTYIKPM